MSNQTRDLAFSPAVLLVVLLAAGSTGCSSKTPSPTDAGGRDAPVAPDMSVVDATSDGNGEDVLRSDVGTDLTTGDTGGDATTADTGGDATADDAGSGAGDATADGAPSTDAAGLDGGAGDATMGGPFALVYAGRFNNIDQRIVTATLAPGGGILGYTAGTNEAPAVGTATVDGVFSDGFVSLTRWTNGTLTGAFYDGASVRTIPANDGQHLGLARVGGDLPASGTATYTLAAATRATYANGAIAEGTVTAAALTAHFAGNAGTRVGFTITVAMPDGTFTLVGNGGATMVGTAMGTSGGDAGFRFTGASLMVATDAGACGPDGGACPSSGATRVVFAGPNAERVVVAYVFGAGSIASNRRGALVFRRE